MRLIAVVLQSCQGASEDENNIPAMHSLEPNDQSTSQNVRRIIVRKSAQTQINLSKIQNNCRELSTTFWKQQQATV